MTILGQHTTAETQDLLKAHVYEWEQLRKASAPVLLFIESGKWAPDWGKAYNNFLAVKDRVSKIVGDVPSTLVNVTPAESQFQDLVNATNMFVDLDRRFRVGYNQLDPNLQKLTVLPDYKDMPQPTAPDVDLEAWKATSPIDPIGNPPGKKWWDSLSWWQKGLVIVGGTAGAILGIAVVKRV